jgi:hypothetical protein
MNSEEIRSTGYSPQSELHQPFWIIYVCRELSIFTVQNQVCLHHRATSAPIYATVVIKTCSNCINCNSSDYKDNTYQDNNFDLVLCFHFLSTSFFFFPQDLTINSQTLINTVMFVHIYKGYTHISRQDEAERLSKFTKPIHCILGWYYLLRRD